MFRKIGIFILIGAQLQCAYHPTSLPPFELLPNSDLQRLLNMCNRDPLLFAICTCHMLKPEAVENSKRVFDQRAYEGRTLSEPLCGVNGYTTLESLISARKDDGEGCKALYEAFLLRKQQLAREKGDRERNERAELIDALNHSAQTGNPVIYDDMGS